MIMQGLFCHFLIFLKVADTLPGAPKKKTRPMFTGLAIFQSNLFELDIFQFDDPLIRRTAKLQGDVLEFLDKQAINQDIDAF